MFSVTLLLALAAGPASGFPAVVAKFKPVTLPLDLKKVPAPKTGLTPVEVEQLRFGQSTTKELEVLRTWKADPGEETKTTLWPVGAFKRGDVQGLVVRFDQEFPMGSISDSFLLTYDASGALIDGLHLASDTSTEAGGFTFDSKLEASGAFTGRGELRVPMMEEGLPAELVVTSTVKGSLGANGKVTLSPQQFTTKDGAFTDPKSKEELRVIGPRVFYRGNENKPFQELLVEGDAVRFKKGGKPYQLGWTDARDAVTCKNPDGTVQRFERTW